MKFLTLSIFIFFFSSSFLTAQQAKIDSLIIVIQKLPDDTAKFETLYSLGKQYVITGQYEKALKVISEMELLNSSIASSPAGSQKKIKQKLLSETARSQNLSGVIYHRQSKYPEALSCYFKALKAREESGDRQGMAMAYNNISGTYGILSDKKNELKYLELAITNFEAVNDKKGLAQAYYNQSLFYYRQSELAKALEVNIKAQKLAEEAGDKTTIANCLLHTGSLYKDLKDLDKSNEYYSEALILFNLTGDKTGKATAYLNRAVNYRRMGEYDKSLDEYRLGLQLFSELGDKKNIGSINIGIGNVYWDLADIKSSIGDSIAAMQSVDSAIAYYSRAKEILEELGEKLTYTNAVIGLGAMNIKKNNFEKAKDYLKEGLALSYETGDRQDRMSCYQYLSELHAAKGDPAEALKYHRLYSQLNDSILNESTSKTIAELSTKYESEKKDQQISILEKQREIAQMNNTLQEEKIRRQELADVEKTQRLALTLKDAEVKGLQVKHQDLVIEKQKGENEKRKTELALLQKDNEIKTAVELRAEQIRNFSFAGIAVLVAFGGFTFYRYRQRKQLSEKLFASLKELRDTQYQLIETERLHEQENIRLRISRDLHDDIGSTLSSITMLSHSAMKRLEDKDKIKLAESLVKIRERTQSTLDNMNDIIWSIKPQNDSLSNVLSRMREYAGTILETAGINYSIDFPEENTSVDLTLELKYNLFLVFKEAVNNLAKYAQCTQADMKIKIHDKKIVMIIEDNGGGFDTGNSSGPGGNGLNNMRKRAEESNAVLNIESGVGKGTRVEFSAEY